MSFREYFVIDGADCSVRGCDARYDLPGGRDMSSFRARELIQAELEPLGWSAWVSRSLRLYCPAHAPGTRHAMSKLW